MLLSVSAEVRSSDDVITSEGSLSWSFKTGGEIHSGPTLSADGKLVYFGSRDNHLYAISTGK